MRFDDRMSRRRNGWTLARTLTLTGIIALHCGNTAMAQCPAGIPNNPGCIPPNAWPQNQPGPATPAIPSPPPPPRDFVLKAYGAFAYAPDTGAIGHSNDLRWQLPSQDGVATVEHISKRSAERAALDRCEEKGGGKNCKIIANYHNECAAFMIGTGVAGARTTDAATAAGALYGGRTYVGRGASKIDAQRASQALCMAESAQCAPGWADCAKDFSTKD
ncbi:DUF4189 domain-containing protein [Lysobacter sp. Root690]|uniref:DUF4189 domain-containing protein n=1 Tax=Lysobacter sp. Root690 TaxID=1736588 RepID=UPI000A79C4A0|nr:DUF4189 domain-containing protein [Lysobacter sp. Root690]